VHAQVILIALLVTFGGVQAHAAAQTASRQAQSGGNRTMSDARTQAIELLKLPDAEYFALDEERLLELQSRLAAIYRTDFGAAPAAAGTYQCYLVVGAELAGPQVLVVE
jgi:hypothetical protein